ncbi:hypothetical protein [uncultured Sphingomonas sp.]|uniref:hypothetical protein n=1 Tax=uncultured Sphingomonas sp. TaxID=158754 RepID=UPI0030F955FE
MPLPPAPDTAASKPRAVPGVTPRPNVADQLERLTSRFDELTYRARLATTQADFDDIDELVLTFCRDLRGVVRSPAPKAPPLYVTPCGTGALF